MGARIAKDIADVLTKEREFGVFLTPISFAHLFLISGNYTHLWIAGYFSFTASQIYISVAKDKARDTNVIREMGITRGGLYSLLILIPTIAGAIAAIYYLAENTEFTRQTLTTIEVVSVALILGNISYLSIFVSPLLSGKTHD